MALSFLDRERTIAPRNYNRWLIPPAALAIHLCIGEVYAFSVFKTPLVDHFGNEAHADQHHLQHRHRHAGPVRGGARHMGGAGRPAQGDVHGRAVLVAGLRRRGARRRLRPAVAGLPRLRRPRRDRTRRGLHLSGIDADQVVPRPARARHRPGDHGLRRRRAHRLAAVGEPPEHLRKRAGGRDRALLPHPRRHLLRGDDAGRVHRARAAPTTGCRRASSPRRPSPTIR